MNKQPVITVYRGGMVESEHFVHIAAVKLDESNVASCGDAERWIYARSSAKPLQAIPLVESGAMETFGLTDAELALVAASHNGEERHVTLAAGILAKLGLDASALKCGAHDPYHKPTAEAMKAAGIKPTALHNNCSGKHSGMLALAKAIGAPVEDYMSVRHPVQQRMLAAISSMSGIPADRIRLGTDGCGVPVFGLPLASLALAYARLGTPDDLEPVRANACRRIVGAIRENPECLAGDDRFDTQLIRATSGKLIGKLGADGVFAVAMPGTGCGLAVKIGDGGVRALYPAVTEALLQLGWLSADEAGKLADFHRPALLNWQGTVVGEIVPDFTMVRS
ncbi:asparaginase [Gorillibacterium timonense]|uniref:asparaginase n=1 Tax=Gorillibacterium timonense TaxID=1689269 RepID=UPI000B0FB799|nr:asparaginase [Gorillibacterium timonense]